MSDKFEISQRLREQLDSADPIIQDKARAELFQLQAAAAAAEQVDHPQHYGGADNPYETIKVLAAWLSPEQLSGFCVGNAVKYVSRAGKKGSGTAAEDLRKARWYIDYAIDLFEKRAAEIANNEVLAENLQRLVGQQAQGVK